MFRILMFTSLVASVCALGASDRFQVRFPSRIVGGKPTTISVVPWQVSISTGGKHYCGGAIVSETLVMTAAHCFIGVDPNTIKIRTNSSCQTKGGVLHGVRRAVVHELFNSEFSYDYDIGLIEVSEPFKIGIGTEPIRLVEKDEELQYGASALIAGWGVTSDYEKTLEEMLQAVTVRVVSQTLCLMVYGPKRVTPRMFCAADRNGRKDACQGDSGGPVVVDGKLAGIVSFGSGCGRRGYPGVNTRVSSLRDWWDEKANT